MDLEAQISERLDRQAILNRDDPPPPLFHAILDEAAIRRPVGGPKTMSEQLLRVAELAQRDMIIVQGAPRGRVDRHDQESGSGMGELIWRKSERSTNNGGACVEVAVSDDGERD